LNEGNRILMLGLDAADYDVIRSLIGAGRLPNLARLLNRGVTGRLQSPADSYAGAVWPTFYAGQPVTSHGLFHNKQWRPERMRVEVPNGRWVPARPFWETSTADLDVVIVDVPMVLDRPKTLKGIYLGGWGTHDLLARGSWPGGLWRDLERRFGLPLMPREHFGRQTEDSLSELTVELQRATEQVRDIAIDLLDRHLWQFACIVFGATHRAGHYLWGRAQLLDVYECVDAAVGRVIEHAPTGTLVIAFAVHGMGPNRGWSDFLPQILARMEEQRSGRAPKRGWLYRLKQALPHHWVRPMLKILPASVTDRMVQLWSRRMYDWAETRYFPMPMDEAGYLRVNLCGREREGIVSEGREYDAVCAEIEALVESLCDEASQVPIAGPALRAYRDADPRAVSLRLIPDLIFPWTGPPASSTKRLVSTMLPGFVFDVPRLLPSGRSGNHTGRGWFIAAGPGARGGTESDGHDVLDLLPTILKYLGREADPVLPGRPIAAVTGP
jgi:predicted AlkP superfamily phosphohydrolase/phosphomutase